jgi:hypothetical protein
LNRGMNNNQSINKQNNKSRSPGAEFSKRIQEVQIQIKLN